jgi:ATP-dependent Clp protease adaptor protein ClpS
MAKPTVPSTNKPGPAKPKEQQGVEVLDRPVTRSPRRYAVVLHNDDYTTMEFVVHVLMKLFHKGETAATQIMLHVHHKGYGVVDTFTRDVAETKAEMVMAYAREHGHPLKCTAEPEGFDAESRA